MGHIIDFRVCDKKEDVLRGCESFASANVDRGENPFGDYHGGMTFLKGIRSSQADAFDYLEEKSSGGFYDDYAIQFYDVDSLKMTKTATNLINRLEKMKKDYKDYVSKMQIANSHKSKLVTCKNCESKLAVSYLSKTNSKCPVCKSDLRADYILKRIEKYKADIKDLEKKVQKEKEKKSNKAPIRWAYKVEVHC